MRTLNIFICKSKRRLSSLVAKSYIDILQPINEVLKLKLIDYPLTIVYLTLKWCGYAFNFLLSVLREKSYFPENCEKVARLDFLGGIPPKFERQLCRRE